MNDMHEIRYPLLALANDDDAALSPLMPPGVVVLRVRRHGQGVVFEAGGREYPPERAQGWIAGWAWAGAQGQQTLQLARSELVSLGLADDAELDLSSAPTAERAGLLLAWWSQRLGTALAVLAQRNTLLMRELSRLRSAHDETQTRFERLEKHLLGTLGAGRTRLYSLEPAAALGTLALEATNAVTQRLAGESIGLSDVAIHVASAPQQSNAGQLEVTLETAEDELVAASWQVGGDRLREGGWIRLSMTRSLGVDARTARLRLRWSGPGMLALSMSVRHPDERWCVQGKPGAPHAALALQAWVAVPGTSAAAPVEPTMFDGGDPPPSSAALLPTAPVPSADDSLSKVLDELLRLDGLEFVNLAYRTVLRRDPDIEGLSSYLAQLRSGANKAQLLRALASSQEAVDRGLSEAVLALLPPPAAAGLRAGIRRLLASSRGGEGR